MIIFIRTRTQLKIQQFYLFLSYLQPLKYNPNIYPIILLWTLTNHCKVVAPVVN